LASPTSGIHGFPEMIKKNAVRHFFVPITVGTMLAIFASIRFLDRQLALAVMGFLKASRFLHTATANIPDILFLFVCVSTSAMWLDYFYLSRHKGRADQLRLLQLGANAVPAAYLVKEVLQFVFGRTNTRAWLVTGAPDQVNWFHGGGVGGFPSGHMTVFTAFAVAFCSVYPCYRRLAVLGLAVLGAALIITDYHFLSDVIAGAYVGLLVTHTILYSLQRFGFRLWLTR